MRNTLRQAVAGVLMASVVFGGLGCKKNGGDGPTQRAGAPAAIPRARELATPEFPPGSLDPNRVAEAAGKRIASQLFESLLTVPSRGAQPVPALAERWDESEDGRVYTFHLRKSAVWSDGRPITTADVLFGWERGMSPATRSRNASQYWVIRGAKDYTEGQEPDFSTVGAKAIGPHTLRVELVAPAPYFLDLLTYVIFAPTPRHAIEKHGDDWIRPENIVVNGPFTLQEHKRRERVVLVRNPRYWDAPNVWLDRVVFHITENENAAFDWYETGKVHWTPGFVPIERYHELRKAGRKDLETYNLGCIYYYSLNLAKPPMDDVRVRRAVNMAIDKGKLARQVLGMGQVPATQLVPPMFAASRGYRTVKGDRYDPGAARKLLAEAGYGPSQKTLPRITLLYNTLEGHRRIAEFMQRELQTNLGIEVQLANMEWKSMLAEVQKGDFQIARTSWCADYPDPENFVSVFYSDNPNNHSRFRNAEYDAVAKQLRESGDQARRNELTARAEAILNRELPLVPLYFYTRSLLRREFVRGIEPSPLDTYNFKYVWFGEPGSERPKGRK